MIGQPTPYVNDVKLLLSLSYIIIINSQGTRSGRLSSSNLEDFCWLLNLNAHHKIVKCLINVLLVVFVQNKTILIYGHIIMQFIQLQNVSKETRGITKSLYLFVDGDLIVYLDIL